MAPELIETSREVVAMMFAGGRSIAGLAEEWECEADDVEEAIRLALLESIPKRDGGLKESRRDVRAERSSTREDEAQARFKWQS